MQSLRLVARCPEELLASGNSFSLKILDRDNEIVGYRFSLASKRARFGALTIFPTSQIEGDVCPDWIYFSVRQSTHCSSLVNSSRIEKGSTAITIMANGSYIAAVNPRYSSFTAGIRKDFLEQESGLQLEKLDLGNRTATFDVEPELFQDLNRELRTLQYADLTEAEFEQRIVAAFVSLLTGIEPVNEIPASNRHRIVHQSLLHLKNTPAQRISPLDLADICHCSPRTLQYAFRKTLGISCKNYIDRYRLAQFRAELLSVDECDNQHINDLARQYGFTHSGNLSRAYREIYGRLPSQGCACDVHDRD